MGTTVAGLEGVVAGESEICYIDGYAGVLSYRGYNIHTLADHASFEEVIFLLWNGWLPKRAELDQLKKDLFANRGIPTAVVDFLKTVPQASPMDVLRTAVSMLGIYDPETPDMTPEANARKALRLMAQTSTIVTTFDRIRKGLHVIGGDPSMSFAENFLYSLTGLPIVETKGNDISAYIPTNVISITDGQIFLETDLFNSGVRPAINVGQSVSRVGGDAQIKAMKKVAGGLKLSLSQFRDLEAFASFASDLDAVSRAQLDRGARLVELLKQPQFSPLPVERQVIAVWAGTAGHLDDVPIDDISRFESEFLDFLDRSHRSGGRRGGV